MHWIKYPTLLVIILCVDFGQLKQSYASLSLGQKVQILVICSVVLVAFFIWLLLAQIVIQINSQTNVYQLRFGNVLQGDVNFVDDKFRFKIKTLFFKKDIEIDPLRLTKKPKAEKPETQSKTSKFRATIAADLHNYMRKLKRVFQSFKLHYFKLNLDTDDYNCNAFLFPVFYFMNKKNISMNINFNQYNAINLKVSNRLIKILIAYFL